jgi:tRNA threonylcarbamoyladenosine biosynthesis protein TsaB
MSLKVLGIETTTWVGSLAVVDDKTVVGEYTLNVIGTHSSRLLPALDHLLMSTGLDLSRIDALAVSLGPGSFTGLRIGASTAKGLALAGNKPVVGIPTLDALAQSFRGVEAIICPMLDARKQEVYTALYRSNRSDSLEKLTPDLAVSPKRFLENIDEEVLFLGDGSVLYRPLIERIMGRKASFAPTHLHHPRAAIIALLGWEKAMRGEFLDASTFTPIYVRPSDAELNKGITAEAYKNRGLVTS